MNNWMLQLEKNKGKELKNRKRPNICHGEEIEK
jgi:hypothetical protein